MPLQPCRTALARGSHSLRSAPSCIRAYTSSSADVIAASSSSFSTPTTPTPETFKIPDAERSAAASAEEGGERLARWSQTPSGMKAAMQLDRAKRPHNKIWAVNSSPERLDAMYVRLLGPRGDKVLPEELKWLAVTHKSFDQGRRGFNDRLAMMGKFTLMMEASKMIISQKPKIHGLRATGQRKAFYHAQLAPVDNLTSQNPRDFLDKEKMYKLAEATGLLDVLRWKPRMTNKLQQSGVETVANSALYAIVGAITLQHGSVIASEFTRNKILARMQRGH